jgi:hypothetical protein
MKPGGRQSSSPQRKAVAWETSASLFADSTAASARSSHDLRTPHGRYTPGPSRINRPLATWSAIQSLGTLASTSWFHVINEC